MWFRRRADQGTEELRALAHQIVDLLIGGLGTPR
jgi:hypothetical protein